MLPMIPHPIRPPAPPIGCVGRKRRGHAISTGRSSRPRGSGATGHRPGVYRSDGAEPDEPSLDSPRSENPMHCVPHDLVTAVKERYLSGGSPSVTGGHSSRQLRSVSSCGDSLRGAHLADACSRPERAPLRWASSSSCSAWRGGSSETLPCRCSGSAGALRGVNLAVAGLAVRRLGRHLEPCADPTSEDERGKREG